MISKERLAAEYKLVCKFLWSYGNILIPVAMMLFILKGFTKPLNKFRTEQIYFERFFTLLPILLFYSATYLKYWLTNIG